MGGWLAAVLCGLVTQIFVLVACSSWFEAARWCWARLSAWGAVSSPAYDVDVVEVCYDPVFVMESLQLCLKRTHVRFASSTVAICGKRAALVHSLIGLDWLEGAVSHLDSVCGCGVVGVPSCEGLCNDWVVFDVVGYGCSGHCLEGCLDAE